MSFESRVNITTDYHTLYIIIPYFTMLQHTTWAVVAVIVLLQHPHENMQPWDGWSSIATVHEAWAAAAGQAAQEAQQEKHLDRSGFCCRGCRPNFPLWACCSICFNKIYTSKYQKENEGSGSESTPMPMPSYAILWSTLQAETHKTLTSPHLRRMGTLCAPSSYLETSVIWWWSHAAILLGVHSRLKNNLFVMDRLSN